jgi:Glycosyl transferase 4-like domain
VRILLATTSYPRTRSDYRGGFVRGMSEALAASGHTVRVLAPDADRGEAEVGSIAVRWVRYAWPRAAQRIFHRAGAPENLAAEPLAVLAAPSFCVAMHRALRSEEGWADVVVSHWGVPTGMLAASGCRPHVAIFHSAGVHLASRQSASWGVWSEAQGA